MNENMTDKTPTVESTSAWLTALKPQFRVNDTTERTNDHPRGTLASREGPRLVPMDEILRKTNGDATRTRTPDTRT